ncbi:MAG: nuclease [Pirellulaceae bacterium]|nr:MAG: nuclease [Pirellulaceae bacterium]
MSVRREFLDWNRQPLEQAVDWLYEKYGPVSHAGGEWNMRQLVVVLPTRHAIRQFQRLLEQRSRAAGCPLWPPALQTISRLPEQLYPAQRPFASDMLQQAVWYELLRELPDDRLERLYGGRVQPSRVGLWQLALRLKDLHTELAGEGLQFSDVFQYWQRSSGSWPQAVVSHEQQRWDVLAELEQQYLAKTDELGYWDVQTARLVAVQKHECRTASDIILVGTVDLNTTVRRMLNQIASRVTALIFAPNALASSFDETGCLKVKEWMEAELPFLPEQLELVDGPAEQAERVGEWIAAWAPTTTADQIRIAVPDPSSIPYLVRALEERGAAARWGAGRLASDTRPARLFRAAVTFAQSRLFSDFAALCRHPDLSAWLTSAVADPGWLLQCDHYWAQHLPPLAKDPLPARDRFPLLDKAVALVDQWLGALPDGPLPPAEWSRRLSEILQAIYAGRELLLDSCDDHETIEALSAIKDVLSELAHLPESLLPSLQLGEAAELIFERLACQSVGAAPHPGAIELLGWLDLPFDTAPYAVVTTFNEGYIPESVNADLFLPNSLRRELNLLDNHRRLARDAYATRLLLARCRDVRFLIARRNAVDEPLTPSRLALRGGSELIAQRLLRFYCRTPTQKRQPEPSERAFEQAPVTVPTKSRFVVPKPHGTATLEVVSVTALATYIECPYRFYLRHVLRLEPCTDDIQELDPPGFGTLLHAVFRRFGQSPVKDETDELLIQTYLEQFLDEEAARRFGRHRLPAVEVQIGHARRRLAAFARWQSHWRQQGWIIDRVETEVRLPAGKIPGLENSRLCLVGRIDRIDRNENTGQWAVLDYKSSEKAQTPDQVHRRRVEPGQDASQEWVDLQLPAYRYLAQHLGLPASVLLGYINVPRDAALTREYFAEWTEEQLLAADRRLVQVIQAIEQRQFWPPRLLASPWDDYAWICQETVIERRLPS